MQKKIILLLLGFLFSQLTNAQNNVKVKQRSPRKMTEFVKGIADVTVGEMIPDVTLKIINSPKSTVRISDFKDHLLILDFWDTNCGSCINAMPHMEQLQKIFGEKIRVLPVTYQEENLIREFWKKNPVTKTVHLPTVVADSMLHSFFKHRGVPHEIWIYKGKVIGITDAEHVDEKNIRAVLEGGKPSLPLKYDFYPEYDGSNPLFTTNPTQIDQSNTTIRYAAIDEYRNGFSGGAYGLIRDSIQKTVRVYSLNYSILSSYSIFYQNVYQRKDMLTPSVIEFDNYIQWEVIDPGKYRYKYFDPSKTQGYTKDWMMDYAVCFEAVYPDKGQTEKAIYQSAVQDMNRLLGLNVKWEQRKEKVYIIRDQTVNLVFNKPVKGKTMSNMYGLLSDWNRQVYYPYLFVETVKADKGLGMYIDTTDMLHNIPRLKTQLAAYGLELKEEERMVDKLVFTEINGGLLIDGKLKAAARAEKEAQKGMPGPTPEEGKAFLEANKKKQGIVVLPSGLQYKIIQKGNGVVPDSNSKVAVSYKGTLVNGKIFDGSDLQGKPIIFTVKEMIPGWIEALQLMPEGSKWILYVPSELAYGDHSNMGQLPKSSVLIFEIKLLRVYK